MLAKLQNYYGLTKGRAIAMLINIPIIVISLLTVIVLATINVTAYEIPITIGLIISMFSGTGLVAIISFTYSNNVKKEKQAFPLFKTAIIMSNDFIKSTKKLVKKSYS